MSLISEGFTLRMICGETTGITKGQIVYVSANNTVKICPTSDAGEWSKILGVAIADSPFSPSVQGTYTDAGYSPGDFVPVGVHGVYDVCIEDGATIAAGDWVTPSDAEAGRIETWVAGDVTATPDETTIEAAIAKEKKRVGLCLEGGTGDTAGTVFAKVLIWRF